MQFKMLKSGSPPMWVTGKTSTGKVRVAWWAEGPGKMERAVLPPQCLVKFNAREYRYRRQFDDYEMTFVYRPNRRRKSYGRV